MLRFQSGDSEFSVTPHLVSVIMVPDGFRDDYATEGLSGGANHTADHVIVWSHAPPTVTQPPVGNICLSPHSTDYLQHISRHYEAWLRVGRSVARALGASDTTYGADDYSAWREDLRNSSEIRDSRQQMADTLRGLAGPRLVPRNCLLDVRCEEIKPADVTASNLTDDQRCFRWHGNEYTATEGKINASSACGRPRLACVDSEGGVAYVDGAYAVCVNGSDERSSRSVDERCVPLRLSTSVPDNCDDYLDTCEWAARLHPYVCYEAALSRQCCRSCRRAGRVFYSLRASVEAGVVELRAAPRHAPDTAGVARPPPAIRTCYACGGVAAFSLDCTGDDRASNATCRAGGCWTYSRRRRIRNAWTGYGTAFYRGCRDLRTRRYADDVRWTRCDGDFCNRGESGALVIGLVATVVSLYTVFLLGALFVDANRGPGKLFPAKGTLLDPSVQLLPHYDDDEEFLKVSTGANMKSGIKSGSRAKLRLHSPRKGHEKGQRGVFSDGGGVSVIGSADRKVVTALCSGDVEKSRESRDTDTDIKIHCLTSAYPSLAAEQLPLPTQLPVGTSIPLLTLTVTPATLPKQIDTPIPVTPLPVIQLPATPLLVTPTLLPKQIPLPVIPISGIPLPVTPIVITPTTLHNRINSSLSVTPSPVTPLPVAPTTLPPSVNQSKNNETITTSKKVKHIKNNRQPKQGAKFNQEW